MSATQEWRGLLLNLLAAGVRTEQASAGAQFRGRTSLELLAHRTVWPMSRAVVLCPNRRLGHRFLAAEAAFILSGSNRLEEIQPYAKNLRDLSDDGVHLFGAYGPPFVDQLPYVLKALRDDFGTRQAVSTSWRPRPMLSRDTPCTISNQWVIRPDGDGMPTLHCVTAMRSSDAWLGVPYDVHAFAMMSAYVALHLRSSLPNVRLGNLYLVAGSQHLYTLDVDGAERCLWVNPVDDPDDPIRTDEALPLAPIDLSHFARPRDLVDHLWAVARRNLVGLRGGWLVETLPAVTDPAAEAAR